MCTFLLLIVLLNMIIALISDIFEKIHQNIYSNILKELATLMLESEILLQRRNKFKNVKYLIIMEIQRNLHNDRDNESRIASVQNKISKQLEEQTEFLTQIQINLTEKMTHQAKLRQEKIQNMSLAAITPLSQGIESLEAEVLAYKKAFKRIMNPNTPYSQLKTIYY